VPREAYRVGLPRGGFWKEVLNSDAGIYAGSNAGNGGGIQAQTASSHGHAQSAAFMLPPLSVIIFQAE
jgi:1,4-alpha-glucan branching enzyme